MKKLIILEIIVLIACSVFTYVSFDKNRSFKIELEQKETIAEQNTAAMKHLDDEFNELSEKLDEIRNKDDSKQLDLWRRRLETLKEAMD